MVEQKLEDKLEAVINDLPNIGISAAMYSLLGNLTPNPQIGIPVCAVLGGLFQSYNSIQEQRVTSPNAHDITLGAILAGIIGTIPAYLIGEGYDVEVAKNVLGACVLYGAMLGAKEVYDCKKFSDKYY